MVKQSNPNGKKKKTAAVASQRQSTRAGRGTLKVTKAQLDDQSMQSQKAKPKTTNTKKGAKRTTDDIGRLKLTKKDAKALHRLYYTGKNYFGRDKLYQIARETGLSVSRRGVMHWLKGQELNQVYVPTKKVREVQPTILKEPFLQVGIDLMDMQNFAENGYRYILTGIDLFSKRLYAEALKNKRGPTVARAMEKILETSPKIRSVRSDRGSEFIDSTFKRMLKDRKVHQVFSLASKPWSNGGIERANGTLKRLIMKNMKHGQTKNWVTDLSTLVQNYNRAVNDVTGRTPHSVEDAFVAGDSAATTSTKARIEKKVIPASQRQNYATLAVGLKVRVKNVTSKNTSTYNTLWSKKIYTIVKVMKSRTKVSTTKYRVSGPNGKTDVNTSRVLYRNELQPIDVVEEELPDEEDILEVSKLHDPFVKKGKRFYKVQWKYLRAKKDWTVEPRANLEKSVPRFLQLHEKRSNIEWVSRGGSWSLRKTKTKV